MSESVILPAEPHGCWLYDDEGNREWYPNLDAALRADPRALVSG